MVLCLMESQGSGSGSGAETVVGGNGKASQFDLLPRQNSLYGLTLDEVQNQSGNLVKSLGSMNIDELLNNIWTADPGQSAGMDAENVTLGNQATLQRQASMSFTGEPSKQTVNEVWKEMQNTTTNGGKKPKDRQPTLRETTEDSLVRAGGFTESAPVIRTLYGMSSSIATQIPQQGQWMPYPPPQYPPVRQSMSTMPVFIPAQTLLQPLQRSANPMLNLPFADNHLFMFSQLTRGLSDMPVSARKRGRPDDTVDERINRKKKQMLRNRESAARSRSKKQAYMNELENKVSRLKEENESLRKHKELEKMLSIAPPQGLKYQLRRASSAP